MRTEIKQISNMVNYLSLSHFIDKNIEAQK